MLVMAISLGSLLPLSLLVAIQLRSVLLENTLQVCHNLAHEISSVAKEELLLNNIYVNTRNVMEAQKRRKIHGLKSAFVIYRDGRIVAHNEKTRVGQQVSAEQFRKWKGLRATHQEENALLLRIVDPIFIRYEGRDYWIGASVFEFDKNAIFQPVEDLLRRFWLVSIGAVLLALLATLLFAGRISRPIEGLAEGARKIGSGDLDFRVESHKQDEIGELSRTFNRMAHQIRLSQQRKAEEAALRREMEIAEQIQTSLLPPARSLGPYEYRGFMKTADEVGGDYFDCIPIIETKAKAKGWWFIIGDVSGHGLSAGLTMLMAQTAVQTVLQMDPSQAASRFFDLVNRVLYSNIRKLGQSRYMTAAFFKANARGQFQYAGLHLDLLVYRKKSGKVEVLPTEGLWLGIEEDLSRDLSVSKLKLNTGDLLFLFTDGLVEAMNAKQEMFSQERVAALLEKHGHKELSQIESEIMSALLAFSGSERFEDDVTFLMIRKTRSAGTAG